MGTKIENLDYASVGSEFDEATQKHFQSVVFNVCIENEQGFKERMSLYFKASDVLDAVGLAGYLPYKTR